MAQGASKYNIEFKMCKVGWEVKKINCTGRYSFPPPPKKSIGPIGAPLKMEWPLLNKITFVLTYCICNIAQLRYYHKSYMFYFIATYMRLA